MNRILVLFLLLIMSLCACSAHQSYQTKKFLGYPVLPREESLSRAKQILFGDDNNENLRIGLTQFEIEESEYYLKFYLADDPKSKEANLYLALVYNENGDFKKSEELFLKVYEMNPNDVAINIRIAEFYYQKSEFQKALPYFQKTVEQNPLSGEARMRVALIYENLGNFDLALENYFISREFDSKNKFSNIQSEKLKWIHESKIFFSTLKDNFIFCSQNSKEKISYKVKITNIDKPLYDVELSDTSNSRVLECIKGKLNSADILFFSDLSLIIEYVVVVNGKSIERELIKPTWLDQESL